MLGNVPRGLVIAKLEKCRLKKSMIFRESLGGAESIPLPSQAVVSTQFRGMDTALLKLMPDLRSLKQPTYRMLRKKMQIFEKACQARGQLVVTEAALMMLLNFRQVGAPRQNLRQVTCTRTLVGGALPEVSTRRGCYTCLVVFSRRVSPME